MISAGRSEVHASQAKKLIGLCRVQTGHVHPLVTGVRDGGSGDWTNSSTRGLEGASAGAGAVAALEGSDFGFGFFELSATRRLTGRSECCLTGGALVLGLDWGEGASLLIAGAEEGLSTGAVPL